MKKEKTTVFIPDLNTRILEERPPAITEFQLSSLRRKELNKQSKVEYQKPQIANAPNHRMQIKGNKPESLGTRLFTV